MSKDMGDQFAKDIQAAMNDPDIQQNIKDMIENNDVELLDDEKTPFLQKQLTELLENQNQMASTGGDGNEQVNIRVESPSMSKLKNAELQINEKKYSDLQ